MSPIIKALLSHTYTVTDLHRRLRLMQQVLETIHYEERQQLRMPQQAKQRADVLKNIAKPAEAAVLSVLSEELWQGFTPATLTTKMNALFLESESLPVMTLYIPVPFTDNELAPLGKWARAHVAPGLLFDVHIDPRVVGGCAFVYNDKHFDWSLRRYLRSKRGMVTSLLNAYGE